MEVQKKPDYLIFADGARAGELEDYPNIERGWGLTLEQTRGKPPLRWMNGAFNRLDKNALYLLQQGVPEWDKSVKYPANAIIKHNGALYIASDENSNKEPNKNDVWATLIQDASTEKKGVVQLSNDPNSSSDNTVPTSKALKQVSDLTNTNSSIIDEVKPKADVIRVTGSYTAFSSENRGASLAFYDSGALEFFNHNKGELIFRVADNHLSVSGVKVPNIDEVFKLGDFRLFPFPPNELPFGWYLRNGDRHPVDSNIGRALKSLSENYKFRWLIFELDGYINLPSAFNYNGDGYFERPVDGVKRQAGSLQGDSIRNITGTCNPYGLEPDHYSSKIDGAFYKSSFKSPAGYNHIYKTDNSSVAFDASRVVPTAHENRPINIGMTPAIYLGV